MDGFGPKSGLVGKLVRIRRSLRLVEASVCHIDGFDLCHKYILYLYLYLYLMKPRFAPLVSIVLFRTSRSGPLSEPPRKDVGKLCTHLDASPHY